MAYLDKTTIAAVCLFLLTAIVMIGVYHHNVNRGLHQSKNCVYLKKQVEINDD